MTGTQDPMVIVYAEGRIWADQALCKSIGPDVFFDSSQGQFDATAMESAATAKRICAACPVRSECLDHAIKNDERFGIWGGMTQKERATYKKNLRKKSAA